MTQEITVVPVDARTADWPRKVATVLNRLQNTTALAGGSAAWGGITGTLSAQTDLQTALNAKQATLVSGTNIKTVNSTTLLGSGNLAVGTVTSVGLTVPTGLSIAGSPVTSSGTLAVTFTSGYSIPTDAAQTNWNTAFGWGNHASAGYQPGDAQLTSLAGLSFTGNALKVVRVNAGETDFELATASGSGTVTTTGSPASGNLAKFSGATSITNGDLSGDVTTSGTLAATIANDAVTYAKMQNISAASRLLGRGSAAGSGDTQELTAGLGLEISSTTLRRASGTSFPGSPATDDLFYRTDRRTEYFYDGTRWLSTKLFALEVQPDGALPQSATFSQRARNPWWNVYDIYVERLSAAAFITTTTASNYFTCQLTKNTSGAGNANVGSTFSTQSITQSAWVGRELTINEVVASTIASFDLVCTETGTANGYIVGGITYRLIG